MCGTCTANIATWCFLCSDFVGGCRMFTKSRYIFKVKLANLH